MTEYQSPTLGHVTFDASYGGAIGTVSFRVTTLGDHTRIMFDSGYVTSMMRACAISGHADDFDDWLAGYLQMPIGADR